MNTRAIVILMQVKSIYFGLECEHVWDIDDYIALTCKTRVSVEGKGKHGSAQEEKWQERSRSGIINLHSFPSLLFSESHTPWQLGSTKPNSG